MRRLRRFQRNHRQPYARSVVGLRHALRRHIGTDRSSGNVRGRNDFDEPLRKQGGVSKDRGHGQ